MNPTLEEVLSAQAVTQAGPACAVWVVRQCGVRLGPALRVRLDARLR